MWKESAPSPAAWRWLPEPGRVPAVARSPLIRLVAAALLLSTTACYTYVPTTSDPTPGTVVRARLTAAGSVRLMEVRGNAVRTVEGAVVSTRPDTLALAMWSSAGVGPGRQADTLALGRQEIAGLELKQFSAFRTGVAIGVASLALAALVVAAFHAAGGGGAMPGGTTDHAIFPILTWPRH
jgi:hypothetical protein